MAEDREKLRRSLDELRNLLVVSTSLDPAIRERLEQTIDEIEAALDSTSVRESSPEAANSTLAGRLSDATFEFEASHPNLSGAVGSVVDALSRMGI